MEALSHDPPELAFHPSIHPSIQTRWCAAKYDDPEFERERDAMRFNDGSSSDPWRDGAMAYLPLQDREGRPERTKAAFH